MDIDQLRASPRDWRIDTLRILVEVDTITGGLGGAVSGVAAELGRYRVTQVAVEDCADSGDAEALYGKYGLSEENRAAKA